MFGVPAVNTVHRTAMVLARPLVLLLWPIASALAQSSSSSTSSGPTPAPGSSSSSGSSSSASSSASSSSTASTSGFPSLSTYSPCGEHPRILSW